MKKFTITERITNKDSDSINRYFTEINGKDFEALSNEEEIELSKKIKLGDNEALCKLVKANLKFVITVAKVYQGNGLPLSDLISFGNIGCIKAANVFDGTRGFRFITYAVYWIRQSIMQALSDQGKTVRLPLNHINAFKKLKTASTEFEQMEGRMPSYGELGDILNIDEESIAKTIRNNRIIKSIDEPISEEENSGTLLDLIPNTESDTDDTLIKESLRNDIHRILGKLPEREKDIIMRLYGIGCVEQNKETIAEKYGLTSERIRQLKQEGIKILRKNKEELIKYL